MSRACTVCAHPALVDVDRALVAGEPAASIAERHGLGRSALARHRTAHVSAALAALPVAERADVARTLVDEVRGLARRAGRLMDAAEMDGASAKVLAAMAETRRCLELVARLTGELDERPQVAVINLQQSPEWIEVRTKLMQALAPFPAARVAVAEALS